MLAGVVGVAASRCWELALLGAGDAAADYGVHGRAMGVQEAG